MTSSTPPDKPQGSQALAVACLLGAIVCWGAPPVMLRHFAVSNLIPDGYTTNLVRYPVSTVLYCPLVFWAIRRGGLGKFWLRALVPAAVNIVGQTLFAWTAYFAEAGMTGFLVRISIVWSVVGAFWLFPDERPLARSKQFWAGAGLAVVGFTVMSAVGLARHEMTTLGVIVVLLCGMLWGMYDVSVRHAMGSLHPLVVFGVIGNYSSLGLILMSPLGQPASVLKLSAGETALLIASALIGIAAAHGMYYMALQRLGVVVSALTCLMTPFISLLGGRIFLGERFSPAQWLGGIILLTGALLAMLSRQRMLHRRAEPIEVNPD